VELFRLLLRIKGMEIYFGPEKGALIARRLWLVRVPGDEEMRGAAFLFAVYAVGLPEAGRN
jgi:hypothetical protein